MRKNLAVLFLVLAFVTAGAMVANTAKADPFNDIVGLINNGNGLIYDTGLNITWYDYTYPPPENSKNWYQVTAWAAGLNVGGVTGWQLPTDLNMDGSGPSFGYNVTGSELGYLYYINLGFPAGGLPNGVEFTFGPFTNLTFDYYWTSTIGTGAGGLRSGDAGEFLFSTGFQGSGAPPDTIGFVAIAVHSGDVLGNGVVLPDGPPAATPLPGAILLLGPGLVGLAAIRKRYKA